MYDTGSRIDTVSEYILQIPIYTKLDPTVNNTAKITKNNFF